ELVESGTVEDIFQAEIHHPYTIGLFGSIPNIEQDVERLNSIKGDTPDPMRLPSGCKFHPRCPKRMDICKKEVPKASNSGSHIISCHLY
ncbi:MAG: ABC transporter ATP-binding protein, partial [Tissierellia bacterium]|nr:ABC transporter ATP-binding protein [Tissierellia bacterium]